MIISKTPNLDCEEYVDFEIDLLTDEGTAITTLELTALVWHNSPKYKDEIDILICSYWFDAGSKYESLTEAQTKALLERDEVIHEIVEEKLISLLDLSPSPPEYFGHHEYGLER